MFELSLTPPVVALFAVLVVAVLYLLLGFRHYVASVSSRVSDDSSRPFPTADEMTYPSVSVIVYSENDAANLEVLLSQILDQDYPGMFEVIVVNDGAVASTKDVIARLEREHSNLYMTFTPLDSRAVSRKKLAVTLGIKAARYDVVIHTTGNCQIPSRLWLRAMCRHFTSGTDMVIGYAAPAAAADEVREPRKRLHAFDNVRSAVEYLSWAIAGRPYRGTSHNLAYRRELFFSNKGFSRSLHLKYGDDDVFVSQVADKYNTVTELSADSMVLSVEENPAAAHRARKLRYGFTAPLLKGHARLFFGSCTLVWWIAIGATVALSLLGLPSLLPLIVGCTLLLACWIILMVAWRKTSIALWSRGIFITFPWFMSIHPIYTLYYRLRVFLSRKSNYSWG
ncbi:MAG: glycosyltransferase [Muribaculaceae bacterium]|nr:glycosyltransferase [Muribaculaceae bacterium]